jgi:hypothetical protein
MFQTTLLRQCLLCTDIFVHLQVEIIQWVREYLVEGDDGDLCISFILRACVRGVILLEIAVGGLGSMMCLMDS